MPTTESFVLAQITNARMFFAHYYIFSVDCAAHSNLFAQAGGELARKKANSSVCACNIELFIRMLRARRSFLLATEERHGTHYRRTEFAIRLVLCAPLTLVDTRRPTHPPLPSTTLCVEHHLIDLSLYCVLYSCVRNDAPVCLCFSSRGLLLSRN